MKIHITAAFIGLLLILAFPVSSLFIEDGDGANIGGGIALILGVCLLVITGISWMRHKRSDI